MAGATDRIAEIEARRNARKAALLAQEDEQRATDIEALDKAEVEHGDSNVCHMDVPYTPGMPTMVIARCPSPVHVKRYQDRVKPKANGRASPDAPMDAARELTAMVLVYPSKEVFAELVEQRPSLDLQLGVEALGLAQASRADEGKG
jgi:hypothetical protein